MSHFNRTLKTSTQVVYFNCVPFTIVKQKWKRSESFFFPLSKTYFVQLSLIVGLQHQPEMNMREVCPLPKRELKLKVNLKKEIKGVNIIIRSSRN